VSNTPTALARIIVTERKLLHRASSLRNDIFWRFLSTTATRKPPAVTRQFRGRKDVALSKWTSSIYSGSSAQTSRRTWLPGYVPFLGWKEGCAPWRHFALEPESTARSKCFFPRKSMTSCFDGVAGGKNSIRWAKTRLQLSPRRSHLFSHLFRKTSTTALLAIISSDCAINSDQSSRDGWREVAAVPSVPSRVQHLLLFPGSSWPVTVASAVHT